MDFLAGVVVGLAATIPTWIVGLIIVRWLLRQLREREAQLEHIRDVAANAMAAARAIGMQRTTDDDDLTGG